MSIFVIYTIERIDGTLFEQISSYCRKTMQSVLGDDYLIVDARYLFKKTN